MPYPDAMSRPRTVSHPHSAPRETRSRKNWEKAYDEIKDLILDLGIRPGENLSENALAARLGISRTPVREALKALEREGLVVTDGARKRAFVLSIRDVDEIFDLKIALEGKVARWAAERGSAAERTALGRIAEHMTTLAQREPPSGSTLDAWHGKWLALDEEYHDQLFRMAGNRRAEQTIRIQNSLWHRLRLGMIAIEGRIGRATGEHGAIARAVVAGSGVEAEKLMAEHLRRLQEMLRGIMQAFHYPPTDARRAPVDTHGKK